MTKTEQNLDEAEARLKTVTQSHKPMSWNFDPSKISQPQLEKLIPQSSVEPLLEALGHYVNITNWAKDENGKLRIWLEPDSETADAYHGYELAGKAIKEYRQLTGETK